MKPLALAILLSCAAPAAAPPPAPEAAASPPAVHAHCVRQGDFPDPACTPGAAEPLTREQLCTESTRARRHVTETTKRQVFAAYGVAWEERGHVEVDHRVPLCAGGSNDVTNLWIEPGYEEKDRLEARVCRAICAGTMTVEEGQRVFLGDWTKDGGR